MEVLDEEIPLHISLVPHEHIMDAWEHVSHFIDEAVKHTGGRYTLHDALTLVIQHGYLLWVALGEDKMLGAAITGITTYPRRRVLSIMFLGGVEGRKSKDVLLETMKRFAADQGCDAIEGYGRAGWERYLKDDGYKPLWLTFEIPVPPKAAPPELIEHELERTGG